MTTWALLVAFLSGVAWSGLDVARKSLTQQLAPSVIAACLSVGMAVLFGIWAAFGTVSLPAAAYVAPAMLSTLLSVAVQVLILESIRVSEISRTIPLLSITPVVTSLFGLLVLDEHPSPSQWAGIALVLVGALGLGLSRRETGEAIERDGGWHFDRGAFLMIGAAVCISAAAPFDKLAVAASSTPFHGFIQGLGASIVLLGYLAWRDDLHSFVRAFRRNPGISLAVVLALAALGLQFTAYREAMVGAVETIKRGVSLVGSLGAGYLMFGEQITRGKLGTVTMIGLGVLLILY